MCGQFYIKQHSKLKTIYPGDNYQVMVYKDNQFIYKTAKWGFEFAKDKIINARGETLNDKKLFNNSLPCLILASGYYEWDYAKMKTDLSLEGESYLYMAGIYKTVEDHLEYVIITTKANESVASIHSRMPLIFTKEEAECWLKEKSDTLLNVVPPKIRIHQAISQTSLDL